MNSRAETLPVDLESYRERRPPISVLVLAVLAVAAAFALLTLTGFSAHIVGYLLGSFVSVILVTIFIKIDLRRRNSRDVVYLEARGVRFIWSFVLASGIAACVLHAWYMAAELAERS